MSIRKMAEVWDLDLPHGSKLVLLSLADQANDAGVCWPSLATIGKRCGYSERGLRDILVDRERRGLIARQLREGRATLYTVTPAPVAGVTPAVASAHPGNDCRPPRQWLPPTPADVAGDPGSGCPQNPKEPSKEPTEEPRSARARRSPIRMPEGLNFEALALWDEWLTSKLKPMNDISRPLVAAHLVAFGNADRQLEVVRHSIARGWVSLHAPRPDSPPPGGAALKERRKSADELVREARERGEVVDELG